jgi:nicotinate-nucleotide adenylyltransferase
VGRLGILGGTFNPPHLGHLALARHALGELGLDRVLLVPAFRSPFKQPEEDPRPEHRLAMCRLAVADAAALSVSALEIERGGPSYTADTLRALDAADPDTHVTLIVGSDVACTLPTWREPRELLALAEPAVALRAEAELQEREKIRAVLAPLLSRGRAPHDGLRFLTMPAIDISSSRVRERVRAGLAVEDLVGPAVGGYIAAHGLYGDAARGAGGAA